MKLSASISSAVKLITLSMALLAVLTVINTSTVHAAPGRINVVQQADPGAPTVPVGPRGPLLNRRAGSSTNGSVKGMISLGKTHPTAVEKPEPSGGELSMRPGHAKRDDEEGKEWWEKEEGWQMLKRADADAVAERKNEWWWGPKAKRSVPAGEEKDAAAVNKRSSDEEQELGWWGWNGKRETDDARGFEVKELAKTHNKSKSKDATKKERGEGGEENRWNFKREIHQGDAKEHSGWVDSVVVRSGIPERPLKSEQKKRKREVEDSRGLEKGGWHFKLEEGEMKRGE